MTRSEKEKKEIIRLIHEYNDGCYQEEEGRLQAEMAEHRLKSLGIDADNPPQWAWKRMEA